LIEINFANHRVIGTVDSRPAQTGFPFIKEHLAPFQAFSSRRTPQASPGTCGDGNNVSDVTGFDRRQTASAGLGQSLTSINRSVAKNQLQKVRSRSNMRIVVDPVYEASLIAGGSSLTRVSPDS